MGGSLQVGWELRVSIPPDSEAEPEHDIGPWTTIGSFSLCPPLKTYPLGITGGAGKWIRTRPVLKPKRPFSPLELVEHKRETSNLA